MIDNVINMRFYFSSIRQQRKEAKPLLHRFNARCPHDFFDSRPTLSLKICFLSCNPLVRLSSGGSMQHSYQPFDEMSLRNPVYAINSRIRAHVQRGEADTAWFLFSRMQRAGMELDEYTFTAILGACASLSSIKQVHSLLVKIRFTKETVLKTALIDMYFKCGSLIDAVHVFEKMELKDVVAWNSMISGFIQNDHAGKALGLFLEMQKTGGIEFSGFTLCILLKACSLLTALPQGKQVHALVVVRGCDLIVLGTALVGLYSGCGLMEDALKVFGGLSRRDQGIYNALISGFVQNGRLGEAFSVLATMHRDSTKPNQITFTTVLAACTESSSFWNGEQIHCQIIRWGFKSDTILCNALLDMYAKCGKINSARRVFDGMKEKNVVSWTSIIDAYGGHGQGIEAVSLFERMVKSDAVSPNSVTFLAVLWACCHCGLVNEGRKYFIAMREKHGVNPDVEHYACFIDLLGRSGAMDEGWSLLHDMHTEQTTTSAVWTAMLNACRINMDAVRGELAAKRLLELEPDNPAHYVLVSNFYAAVGRWEIVEKLRRVMKEKGLHKQAGSSWLIFQQQGC